MIRKLIRSLGFAIISCSTLLTPVIAGAESATSGEMVSGGFMFSIPGGLITGIVLVSMSRKKHKATRAEQYIKSKLQLNGRSDTYLRTTTSKTKIKSDN